MRGGGHHPLRQPARGRAVQEQARAARHPRLHPPLHQGLPDRRRPDRQRRGLRRQRLHRDRASRSWSSPGPGPGSGKLATCLSQLYHEYRRGRARRATPSSRPSPSGTCRSSTPSTSPTRRPRPTSATSTSSTPSTSRPTARPPSTTTATSRSSRCCRRILERITGAAVRLQVAHRHGRATAPASASSTTRSCREAARQEIIRRYFRYACEYAMGFVGQARPSQRVELLMKELERQARATGAVVGPARGGGRARPRRRGKGQRGHLLRRGHRAAGRHHRHRQELAADARRLEPRPQRRQAPGRDPGQASSSCPPTIIESVGHFKNGRPRRQDP